MIKNCTECETKSVKIRQLQAELDALRKTIYFHRTHRTLSLGLSGETLVTNITSGQQTIHTCAHDIELKNGQKIEVKTANLSVPNKSSPGGKRWQWEKILGQSGNKYFDYLILLGEVDTRYSDDYQFSPWGYVVFLVPFESIGILTTNGVGGGKAIRLGSNPKRATGKGSVLYEKFQIDVNQISNILSSEES